MLTDCRNGTSAESIIACLSQDALWTWFNVFIALAKKRGGGRETFAAKHQSFLYFCTAKADESVLSEKFFVFDT